jgi:hypothetical protein
VHVRITTIADDSEMTGTLIGANSEEAVAALLASGPRTRVEFRHVCWEKTPTRPAGGWTIWLTERGILSSVAPVALASPMP